MSAVLIAAGPEVLALAFVQDHPTILLAIVVAITAAVLAIPRLGRAPAHDEIEEVSGADPGMVGFLRQALSRSRAAMRDRFDSLFAGNRVDDAVLDELETTLLGADVGMPTTTRILTKVRAANKAGERDGKRLREIMRSEMRAILTVGDSTLNQPEGTKPWVILVVGVNGSGKTTTIGKLAAAWTEQGKKVMLAAGDTFRAAAIEQLQVWAERSGADLVGHQEGADPGAVVYDALSAAVARGHDIVIIDTAGRLQTKKPLMEQLSKIRRVIDKVVPGAPHETLLVLDGTMGQNALSQANLFHEATPLTGVIVTKLDGTARGGMVLTLAAELGLPVKRIGVGEKVTDLRPFDPAVFVEALT